MERRPHGLLGGLFAVPVLVVGAMNGALAAPESADPDVLAQTGVSPDLDGATFTTTLGNGVYSLAATAPTTPIAGLLTVEGGEATVDMEDSWSDFTVLSICASPAVSLAECTNEVRRPWFAADGITGAGHAHLLAGVPAFPVGVTPTLTTTLPDGTYQVAGKESTGECSAHDVSASVESGRLALDGIVLCGDQTETVWNLRIREHQFSIGVFVDALERTDEPAPTEPEPTDEPTSAEPPVPTDEPTHQSTAPATGEPRPDPVEASEPVDDAGAVGGGEPDGAGDWGHVEDSGDIAAEDLGGFGDVGDMGDAGGFGDAGDLGDAGPAIISGPAEIMNVGGSVMMLLDDHEPVELTLGASLDQEPATGVTLGGIPAGMRFNTTTMTLSGSPSTRATTRMTATYTFASGRALQHEYYVSVTHDIQAASLRFAGMHPRDLLGLVAN